MSALLKSGDMSPQSKLIFQEREKFRTSSRVVLENAKQAGGFHDGILLFDAAHHHAKMFRLHDDRHSGWLKTIHERFGDLRSEIFLDLQTARKDINNAGNLGKTDDFSIWNVSYVRTSYKRQQMVFAQRIKFDVFDQNDFACGRSKDGIVDNLLEILAVALRQKFEGVCRPLWRPP